MGMMGMSSSVAAFVDTEDRGIAVLYSQGFVEGYPDGTFRPETPINRAELIKILMPVAGKSLVPATAPCFPDVPMGMWYTDYVCTAKAKGWIAGYPDGTFKPEARLNRAEAAKIASYLLLDQILPESMPPLAEGIFSDVASTDWYSPYVKHLAGMVYVDEGRRFDPGAAMTRGAMAQIVYRHVLTTNLAPIPEVASRWDGETVTEVTTRGDALRLLEEDFALYSTKVQSLTPQMLLAAQAEQDERHAMLVQTATNLTEAELKERAFTVALEQDGVLYGVLRLDGEGAQAKPSFLRAFYVTWAFVAFDVETNKLLAYTLRTHAVDRPSLMPTIAMIPEVNAIFVLFHGEGPAPGSFYPNTLLPETVLLRPLRSE